MGFRLRDHTADVAIEAEADGLGATFAAVADGLAAAQCDEEEVPDPDGPDGGERFTIQERAESREALLFDFLDRLIYERDIQSVLPVDHEATVTRDGEAWVVTASARGVPLSAVRAREVKAVTYSEMAIEETDDGWRAYVVMDV